MLTSLSARKLARLNRRQRKKRHVAEFQELGFALSVSFHTPLDEAARDAYFDALIGTVEGLGLAYGGGDTGGFVTVSGRGSVSPAQRDSLLAWLRGWPAVAEARAGDWQDAWYGWN
ncbi:YggL family protein [Crenobacter luteus]|uniref:DUF469 domain-containing protein n=1 Tax=Crenobacter luteus TaxID=1452487 RepID=A0A165EP64_9NEIS|nr:YggL family protein [Crenobacter luteus]KZE27357.1 hypothetical protein AVW16_02075 [Crenobacter luteus]